jgi:lysophospholipase L1-like esterase
MIPMDKISLWMGFLLVLFIGGCSSSGSGTSQSGGGSTNVSSSQQKIVFTGASTIARGDWSSYFGITIDNLGVGGIESTDLKNSIEGQVASKPNKIFIAIGTNNILNRHEGALISDLSAIIDKIKAASPTTKIYIISILPVRDSFSCALIERYNSQIESLCNSKNVKFIYIYNLFKTSTGINEAYYQADGLHLTAAGYRVYADAIRSYVLSSG